MKIFKKHTLGPVAAVGVALLFQTAIMQSASAAPKYSEWSAPVNLGPVINSGFYDYHASVSKNGLSLYFGSDRPGGFSNPNEDLADLYVSQRAIVNDPWGTPKNLGATVNSAWGDGRPVLSRDEHFMYFQSNRLGGLGGGADIWVSWRENTLNDFGWQPPVNLGAGVNSDATDSGPCYFENEGGAPRLYFTSFRLGTADIFLSELMADGTFGPAQLVPELSSPTADAPLTASRRVPRLILEHGAGIVERGGGAIPHPHRAGRGEPRWAGAADFFRVEERRVWWTKLCVSSQACHLRLLLEPSELGWVVRLSSPFG